MAASFKMSRKGVGELLRSDFIEAEMLRRAEVIKAIAESIAPIGGAGDPHPGLYKSSFKVSSTSRGGRKKDRATAAVYNTTHYAPSVEYGNKNSSGHHVLLRAAQIGGK